MNNQGPFVKIRFTSAEEATAGLVITADKLQGSTIGELSRLFPRWEALKMHQFQTSPAFDTWEAAFSYTFPKA